MTYLLELKNVKKSYDGKAIIKNFSATIEKNKFVTLLGPSGCGKTTMLKMIGGFETLDSGEINFNGKSLKKVAPNKRNMCTVFQNYALFPHLNVWDNIAYPLKVQKNDNKKNILGMKKALFSKKEIDKQVIEIIKTVGLVKHAKHAITQLSGGQQQRVAIARALISKPKLLLLDEPLGALDLTLRKELQLELKKLQKDFGITFIYVTHDQEEALTMSNHIIVMNEGHVLQQGSPIDIYNEPNSSWVARFMGDGNHINDATYNNELEVCWDGQVFECVDKGFSKGEAVDIVIRPEDIKINEKKGRVKGIIKTKIFKGVHWEVTVESKSRKYLVHTTKDFDLGLNVSLDWGGEDLHVMKKVPN